LQAFQRGDGVNAVHESENEREIRETREIRARAALVFAEVD
jgi:hypothetical protein